MTDGSRLAAASLIEKVTLVALADLTVQNETPSYPFEVRSAIGDCIDPLADEVIGMPDEAAVSRALNALEADGVVGLDETTDRSPVGKGRPAYVLEDDPDTVLDMMADDDRLLAAIEQVRTD